jgi:hypothetical protein
MSGAVALAKGIADSEPWTWETARADVFAYRKTRSTRGAEFDDRKHNAFHIAEKKNEIRARNPISAVVSEKITAVDVRPQEMPQMARSIVLVFGISLCLFLLGGILVLTSFFFGGFLAGSVGVLGATLLAIATFSIASIVLV